MYKSSFQGVRILKSRIRLTGVQVIVLSYFGAALLGTFLLLLPIFHEEGVELSLIDALFTTVSAISVTGLTVVNTAETFNTAGIIVLSIFIQFGGIGIMTLGTFIWVLMGKKIGIKERQLIMIDHNRTDLSGLVKLMKSVLMMALAIEFVGGLILGTYLLRYYEQWYQAYYYGFFHALSAYTNSGFDIFGNSLQSFANDYIVQSIIMILLILGGIGFPVIIELREFIRTRHNKRNFRFSLYTKLTTTTFFLLLFLGALGIFLLEKDLFLADKSWSEKIFYSLFNSVTARNGGFATMDVSLFSSPTLLLISALMVIGASPSSVGGGIRTTTFAVVTLALFAYAKGDKEVNIFNRRLDQEDILKSFVVFTAAAILLVFGIIFLGIYEQGKHSLMQIIFEVSSAFGTTGLSMGITSGLSNAGKILITIIMFVGRIGLLSLLFVFRKEGPKPKVTYPSERIIIG